MTLKELYKLNIISYETPCRVIDQNLDMLYSNSFRQCVKKLQNIELSSISAMDNNIILFVDSRKVKREQGSVTIEEAINRFGIPREQVFKYECMECGAVYYGKFHSKFSSPEICPICDCEDDLFIKSLGRAEKREKSS